MTHYLRVLGYLKGYRAVFAAAVVAMFLFAVLDAFSLVLFIPFLEALFAAEPGPAGAENSTLDALMTGTVGRFVDLQGEPLEAVQGIIVFILVIFAVKNLFDFLRNYLVTWVEQGVTRDLRDSVYDHLLDLDLEFFGRTKLGQIVSRLTHDVEQLRSLVTKEVAKVVSSVFEFSVALYWMVLISGRLTIAALVVLPGMLLIWGPFLGKLRRGDRRILHTAGEVNSHIQETLAGVRLVKSSAAEDHERSRFMGLTRQYFRTYVRTERLRALAGPLTEMVAATGTVVLLWYGARLVVLDAALSGEAFIGLIIVSTKLYAPVKYLSRLPASIQPGLAAAERVFEFMDAPVEIRELDGATEFPGLEESIVYDDVTFAYRAGQPVLSGVSLTVPKGSVVALVGPSGAGKSTLVDLLGRFYEVSGGSVCIDGTDIREFSVRSLRRSLGIVSQETVLFHDTVRANIAYGLDDVVDEELEQAASAAFAHEFIMDLPQGYDTVVGERGTELSGGQRQRLAIARALLRDPPILIFDEATSALDSEAERLVQRAIERLLTGRTVFVIAHRLSTVQRADQIIVLDRGGIVERGDHESLLAREGLYRHLYELQFEV